MATIKHSPTPGDSLPMSNPPTKPRTAPFFAMVCGDCGNVIQPACRDCEQREHDELCEEHHANRRNEESIRRRIAGVEEIEEMFGCEIRVEMEYDESGPLGWSAGTIIRGLEIDDGHGSTEEAAVRSLRHEIAAAMRAVAEDLLSD